MHNCIPFSRSPIDLVLAAGREIKNGGSQLDSNEKLAVRTLFVPALVSTAEPRVQERRGSSRPELLHQQEYTTTSPTSSGA